MYESKKNSGRKDTYKYQKSSHQKNFHNSTHFGYHKHNKYKQKYNYSNTLKDYDEETIFSKIFDENKPLKKDDLKEIGEPTPTPTIKTCKTISENKENISINSNTMNTQMKTGDMNDEGETNSVGNNENISAFNNNSSCFNVFSENLMISGKFDKKDMEKTDEIINEINNLTKLNNINFNNSINFNVENVLNDLLQKNNDCLFASNEKEKIHLEIKKNYKTPQPFKTNSSSSINLTSNDMKEAYYVPKKLSTIYDMYSTHQQPNFFERRNSFNNFNYMSNIPKSSLSLSNNNSKINNCNNLAVSNNLNLNYFNKNNNNNFLHFNNSNNNFNISNSSTLPFGTFDSNNINNIGNINNINNLPKLPKCLSHTNTPHQNLSKNPFHKMMPQLELNQCILKTQISNNNLFEKDKENTDILEINVKISEVENLTFKIRRYDDMFKTVKIFCEINKLDIKLIRPFIIYIIRALNSIYGIYNINLKSDEIKLLKDIKENFYNEEEESNNDIKEDEKDEKAADINENFIDKSFNNDDNDNENENLCDDLKENFPDGNNSNYDEEA
jgi:hypothetical protein